MSSSRHRAGYQTLIFVLAALLPLGFALFMLVTDEVPLWSGSVLVAAATTSLVIGLIFVISTHSKVAKLLREMGQQNRQLQEAHLEHERLNHELNHVTRHRRELQRQQNDQNRAVLSIAREFSTITTEVRTTASAARVDDLTQQKLDFLKTICDDLVELLELELNRGEPEQLEFVVDQELATLVSELTANGALPETFSVDHEDSDVSANTDRVLFMAAIKRALVTMQPFAINAPLKSSMITYLHAEMDDVVQFTITANGFSITDLDSSQWFSHFQLHSDDRGYYLGPGLGMMITQRYVDQLGGTVTVSAEVSQTITVTLTLPLRTQQEDDE